MREPLPRSQCEVRSERGWRGCDKKETAARCRNIGCLGDHRRRRRPNHLLAAGVSGFLTVACAGHLAAAFLFFRSQRVPGKQAGQKRDPGPKEDQDGAYDSAKALHGKQIVALLED